MRTIRALAVCLSLAVLSAAVATPAGAQNRSPGKAVNPASPLVSLGPGQRARLVVSAWDLDNDGVRAGTTDQKGGVPLTLKFMVYVASSAEGNAMRHKLAGTVSTGRIVVAPEQIVSYEWDFAAFGWDLDNDGLWDLNNDGAIRAVVEGDNLGGEKGTYTAFTDTGTGDTYTLKVSLEIIDKATGKVVLRLGGQDWE